MTSINWKWLLPLKGVVWFHAHRTVRREEGRAAIFGRATRHKVVPSVRLLTLCSLSIYHLCWLSAPPQCADWLPAACPRLRPLHPSCLLSLLGLFLLSLLVSYSLCQHVHSMRVCRGREQRRREGGREIFVYPGLTCRTSPDWAAHMFTIKEQRREEWAWRD